MTRYIKLALILATIAVCASVTFASQTTTATYTISGGSQPATFSMPAYNPALDDNGTPGLQQVEVNISLQSTRFYSVQNLGATRGTHWFDTPLPGRVPFFACGVRAPNDDYWIGLTRIMYPSTSFDLAAFGTTPDHGSSQSTFNESGQQFTTPNNDFGGGGTLTLPVKFRADIACEDTTLTSWSSYSTNDVVAVVSVQYH